MNKIRYRVLIFLYKSVHLKKRNIVNWSIWTGSISSSTFRLSLKGTHDVLSDKSSNVLLTSETTHSASSSSAVLSVFSRCSSGPPKYDLSNSNRLLREQPEKINTCWECKRWAVLNLLHVELGSPFLPGKTKIIEALSLKGLQHVGRVMRLTRTQRSTKSLTAHRCPNETWSPSHFS